MLQIDFVVPTDRFIVSASEVYLVREITEPAVAFLQADNKRKLEIFRS